MECKGCGANGSVMEKVFEMGRADPVEYICRSCYAHIQADPVHQSRKAAARVAQAEKDLPPTALEKRMLEAEVVPDLVALLGELS